MNLIYLSKSQSQALKGCALFMMILSCTKFFSYFFVLFLYNVYFCNRNKKVRILGEILLKQKKYIEITH